jgi:hypothetical protein
MEFMKKFIYVCMSLQTGSIHPLSGSGKEFAVSSWQGVVGGEGCHFQRQQIKSWCRVPMTNTSLVSLLFTSY